MKIVIIKVGDQPLPFDEKEIPFVNDAEPSGSEQRGFAPEQMLACETCRRANPPTRTSCLYCGAPLRARDATAVALQQPTLRKLETWEQGLNAILLPDSSTLSLTEAALGEIAGLVRLRPEDLKRIVAAGVPLPLARAATHDEAAIIESRLAEMGVKAIVVADSELALNDSTPKRARTLWLTEKELVAYPAVGNGEMWRVPWAEIVLMVAGRLFVRQVEVEERKGMRAEREIVDARELSTDEAVLDIYTAQPDKECRITAVNFDYSCLGARKGFITAQNFSTLVTVLREFASHAAYDDSYQHARPALAAVWPLEQRTESRGWRRAGGPGRVSTEAVTTSDNEEQFTRYSRLRRYLSLHQPEAKG